MKKEEALNLLGGEADEYWSEFYDSLGTHYSDLETYIWAGLFGFCCCGASREEIGRIKEALSYADKHQYLPDELQIYGYLLDRWGFTKHGSSIYSAWLTPKGEALLILLNELDQICDMSTTIIKEKKLRTPVFCVKCHRCGTEFTYEGEDVISAVESQTEGTAYGVRCPRCNYPFWVDREIYTYKLK